MSKKILLLISFSLLIPYTLLLADEGDIERLVVPEVQTASTPEEGMLEDEVIKEASVEEDIVHDVEQTAPEDVGSAPTEESDEASHVSVEKEEASSDAPEAQTLQAENESENTPEAQEQHSPEVSQEQIDTQAQEGPSEEEREAKHAEESELREVGAGEEPVE